jgi:hypothetical protein
MPPTKKEPAKIGLFVGMEWSWPPAFIEEVNRRSAETGVIAEYVKIGGTMMDEAVNYRVIVDRISHEVPYYRSYLKNAALQGVKVVNDPFMWTADDKFFGASLITRLGIASPRTVALPNKDYVPGIDHNKSLRNLTFPLDWEGLVAQVGGFPCVLKDAHGGGWKGVYIVHSMHELWHAYDECGLMTMVLQEFIRWDENEYARNMCIGQNQVRVMRYDPSRRFYHPEAHFSEAMTQRLIEDTLLICRNFGYDMNTCEFAIKDGVPYAIDFMNPAPDMDVNSLGAGHFAWMVQTMADEMIRLAQSKEGTRDRYEWSKSIKKASPPKGAVS